MISIRSTLLRLTVALPLVAAAACAAPGEDEVASEPVRVDVPESTLGVASADLKCALPKMTSYCIPNTFKYKVCATGRILECPIGSTCKEYVNANGYTATYCKVVN